MMYPDKETGRAHIARMLRLLYYRKRLAWRNFVALTRWDWLGHDLQDCYDATPEENMAILRRAVLRLREKTDA